MNAMFPANKDVYSPQPHQDGIPVVVMAQERGDEEGEEDGDRPGKKQPGETHLSARDASEHQHLRFKNTGSDSSLYISHKQKQELENTADENKTTPVVTRATFCMIMSAKTESGIVRLSARVPIRDDVRKQPL